MLVRGYLTLFERYGILEKMRPRLSPELAALVARPPLPISWVSAAVFDELLKAAGESSSRDMVRKVAYENTSQQTGQMVLPMLRTLLKLWGATPATLFRNLNSVVTVQVKGTRLDYVPETESSGIIEIDSDRVANDYVYAGWEGTLMYAYEVAGVKGEIGRTQLLEGGRKGRLPVSWEPAGARK